jgi:hypothetical protein
MRGFINRIIFMRRILPSYWNYWLIGRLVLKKLNSVKSIFKTKNAVLGFSGKESFVSFDEAILMAELSFSIGISVNDNPTQAFSEFMNPDG